MGRVGNNEKYEGLLFLSICETRGTITDATAKFLGIKDTVKVAFYDHAGKVYLHIGSDKDDLSGYRRLSKVNGRYGIYTGPFVKAGLLTVGKYEILKPAKKIKGKSMYELKEI